MQEAKEVYLKLNNKPQIETSIAIEDLLVVENTDELEKKLDLAKDQKNVLATAFAALLLIDNWIVRVIKYEDFTELNRYLQQKEGILKYFEYYNQAKNGDKDVFKAISSLSKPLEILQLYLRNAYSKTDDQTAQINVLLDVFLIKIIRYLCSL